MQVAYVSDKIKAIILSLFTDANGQHELSSYSFVLTTIGIHALLAYHEYHGIHVSITEYMTAMSGNVAGHGIAYMTRK